jgi:hypothetical protein
MGAGEGPRFAGGNGKTKDVNGAHQPGLRPLAWWCPSCTGPHFSKHQYSAQGPSSFLGCAAVATVRRSPIAFFDVFAILPLPLTLLLTNTLIPSLHRVIIFADQLPTMSLLSFPIPSCRHYLLAWLRRIEGKLPGCLQGCAVSTPMFEECNKCVLVHDFWVSYADDMVLLHPFFFTSGSALPATIAQGPISPHGLSKCSGDHI